MSVEEAEIWGLQNYAIWESGSRQAIIRSSSFFLAILAPVKKRTKSAAMGKQSMAVLETTSEAQKQV